jgi:hypothetical protein
MTLCRKPGPSASGVSGSNATKTYGKAHCEGETFPITCLFGKVCARSNQDIKDLYHIAPGETHIVLGKFPITPGVSV